MVNVLCPDKIILRCPRVVDETRRLTSDGCDLIIKPILL